MGVTIYIVRSRIIARRTLRVIAESPTEPRTTIAESRREPRATIAELALIPSPLPYQAILSCHWPPLAHRSILPERVYGNTSVLLYDGGLCIRVALMG